MHRIDPSLLSVANNVCSACVSQKKKKLTTLKQISNNSGRRKEEQKINKKQNTFSPYSVKFTTIKKIDPSPPAKKIHNNP
jgi:hypothetical protein